MKISSYVLTFISGAVFALFVVSFNDEASVLSRGAQAKWSSAASDSDAVESRAELEGRLRGYESLVQEAQLVLYREKALEQHKREQAEMRNRRSMPPMSDKDWYVFAQNVGLDPNDSNAVAIREALSEARKIARERLLARLRAQPDPYPDAPGYEETLQQVLSPQAYEAYVQYKDDVRELTIENCTHSRLCETLEVLAMSEEQKQSIYELYREDIDSRLDNRADGQGFDYRFDREANEALSERIKQVLTPEQYKAWESKQPLVWRTNLL